MRQTTKISYCVLCAVFAALLACLLLPIKAAAQNTAFHDLPKDHWAYADVDFLVGQGYMDGYPDGNFKGRKVTTRYDLALIIARILRRMEEKKATLDSATEEERAALGRLTKEFRDELGLLDVRVDTIERRITDNENKIKALESKVPKVKVWGFYRSRGQYIVDPPSVLRDETGDELWQPFTAAGLQTFYHQLYLRFTGKPFGDKVETFYELYALTQGRTWNKLVYNSSDYAYKNAFNNIDDYVTSLRSDNFCRSNRFHMVSNARSMRFRVYAYEGLNGLNDPMNLICEDDDIIDPYQGIEVSGSSGGLSYQGAVYKSDLNWGSTNESDALGGRLVWQLPEKFGKDTLSLGTTYAEKMFDFETVGNTNAVRAVDFNFSSERAGKIQASGEFLKSDTWLKDGKDQKEQICKDDGKRFDMSVQNGGFTGSVKHYKFGRNFRAVMAPAWAYDVDNIYDGNYPRGLMVDDPGDNYGRADFAGEKLTRFALNYDFDNKLLSFANNLSIETTYLTKSWETDPYKPQEKTDGNTGKKTTFQILSDFTDKTTLKYDFVHKCDAYDNEEGERSNALELSLCLNNMLNSKARLYLSDDPDDISETTNDKYNEKIGYFELNSDINPRVFAKGSVENQVRTGGRDNHDDTRIDCIGELTYNLTPTTSLTGGVQRVDYTDAFNPSNSSVANAVLAELKKNFTNKFRGRALYTRAVIDYESGARDSIDRENIYGELIYDIDKGASLMFKFGYDYPWEWRWAVSSVDNGRDFVEVHTQKMFIFQAQSQF